MNPKKEDADKSFEEFLDELVAHVVVVGGYGDPDRYRNKTLEEVYKLLHPNDIILGFKNKRLKQKYQLSRQLRDI